MTQKAWMESGRLSTPIGVEPTQISFLQYAQIKKKQDESPLTFYERICHHARAHLAPVGATRNGERNTEADSFTISHENHVALDWIRLLDPNLMDIVQTEFSTELKEGTQLCELVLKIAHNFPSLLKRGSGQATNLVQAGTDHDQSNVMYVPGSNNYGYRGASSRGRPRPGFQQNRFRGFPNSRGNSNGTNSGRTLYCPNCKFLGSQLNLSVNYNHFPGDCPRKRAGINLLRGEEEEILNEEADNGVKTEYNFEPEQQEEFNNIVDTEAGNEGNPDTS